MLLAGCNRRQRRGRTTWSGETSAAACRLQQGTTLPPFWHRRREEQGWPPFGLKIRWVVVGDRQAGVGAVAPLNPPSTVHRIPIICFPRSGRSPLEDTGTTQPPGDQIKAGLPPPLHAATMTVEEEGKSRPKSPTRHNHTLIEAGDAGSAAFASPQPWRKNRRRIRRASGDAREHPSPEV